MELYNREQNTAWDFIENTGESETIVAVLLSWKAQLQGLNAWFSGAEASFLRLSAIG